jgi:hypothetical protein
VPVTCTLFYLSSPTQYQSSKYKHHTTKSEKLHPVVIPSELACQGFIKMGSRDIRKTPTGSMDICLRHQHGSCENQDDSPPRSKPTPVQILLIFHIGIHHSSNLTPIGTSPTWPSFHSSIYSAQVSIHIKNNTSHLCDLQLLIGNQAAPFVSDPI